MTEACQKCAQMSETAMIIPPQNQHPQQSQQGSQPENSGQSQIHQSIAAQRPGDALLPVSASEEGIKHGSIPNIPGLTSGENGLQENLVHQPTFDAEKLHQAILAYRPVSNI